MQKIVGHVVCLRMEALWALMNFSTVGFYLRTVQKFIDSKDDTGCYQFLWYAHNNKHSL